ncbi:MAG TPA: YceD family protein [Arachnia sp.]|nr:YceD family protein [Arachnia sp.]HMT87092.1 YceD family protein [Arachnia sp.]
MRTEHRHPDRRSPWVIETHDVLRQAGSMKELRTVLPAPAELGTAVIGVPEGSDISLELKLEAVVDGVLARGRVDVQLHGSCSRCLSDVAYDDSFDLRELYFYPGKEVEEDESLVLDETVDLEVALRDAVVLELPFTPLCDEDCLGLCPDCGFNLNDDPAHEHGDRIDPRWEKLTGFTGSEDN